VFVFIQAKNCDYAFNFGPPQYPGYVAAWIADTGRELDLDTDLFPALGVEPSGAPLHHGQPVIPGVRGQQTLDWAVEHVNHWGTQAVIFTDLIPSRVTLNIPATGTATFAIVNAAATAHAGAHVEAHRRSRITALHDSDVRIYPGAAVSRHEGAYVTLAPESRMPLRGGAFRDTSVQQRARLR
jgi:hypothetical protein